MQGVKNARVYFVTAYGADPTGKSDSTEALLTAIADAVKAPHEGFLMEGIIDVGGAQINLEGGNYLITQPLRLPAAALGNLMVSSFIQAHFLLRCIIQIFSLSSNLA